MSFYVFADFIDNLSRIYVMTMSLPENKGKTMIGPYLLVYKKPENK